MAKHGKKYKTAAAKIEDRSYNLEEAVQLAKENATAKFDETMDMALRLGVDPRHADQMVRGTLVLPHGTGRELKVLVFAQGEKVKEAEEAGADYVGGEDLAKKIEGGWVDFDSVVSTPDMMRVAGKLGRVLGPRGMMPNPKTGTVTFDLAEAIGQIKAGRIEFRVEKTGIIHDAFRQGVLLRGAAGGERSGRDRRHPQGEACRFEGQVREVGRHLELDGPGNQAR